MHTKKHKTSLDVHETMINAVSVLQDLISKSLIKLILSKAKSINYVNTTERPNRSSP